VNVEGAHEDAYNELGCVHVLPHYVFNAGRHSLLYYYYLFAGLDPFDVHNGPISRTDNVFALSNGSVRIAEEPDVAPEKKRYDYAQSANQDDTYH
jgi:hypothetical protein